MTDNTLTDSVQAALGAIRSGTRPFSLNMRAQERETRVTSILGQTYALNPAQRDSLRKDLHRMLLLETYLELRIDASFDVLDIKGDEDSYWLAFGRKDNRFNQFTWQEHTSYLHVASTLGFNCETELLPENTCLPPVVCGFNYTQNPNFRLVASARGFDNLACEERMKAVFELDGDSIIYLLTWQYVQDYLSFVENAGGPGKKLPRFFNAIWPSLVTNDALVLKHQVGLQALTLWNLANTSPPASFTQLREFAQMLSAQLDGTAESEK